MATPAAPDMPAVENRGPAVLAVTLWMFSFSTVFVGLRCVSRLGIVKRWAWDDTFIIISWFLAFGFSFSICWGVHNGLGLHEVDIPPENNLPLRKSEYAFSVLYNPVLMATKTSILCFYLTLARNQDLFKWATWATMAVVNIAGLALTLLNVFQCHPMWTLFLPSIPSFASCTDLVTIYLSSAPVNIVTDLMILVLPFPILTQMRLPLKQKIILIITFSFGAFVAAVDVVRIAYLQQAFEVRLREVGQQNAATSKALQQDDFSWYASLSFLWSAIEVHIGIICACVPSLKPLVARFMPSLLRNMANPNDTSALRPESQNPTHNTKPSALDSPSPKTPTGAFPDSIERQMALFAHLDAGETSTGGGSPTKSSHSTEQLANGHTAPSIESHSKEQKTNGVAGGGLSDETGDAVTEMDFMEFLTSPDTTSPRRFDRPPTHISSTTTTATSQRRGSVPFFDFYNMKRKKPMTRLSNKQAFGPLLAVTTLFFLWGFSYGLLDVLNSKFAQINNISSNQALGLHASYFGAYFFGPLTVGQKVLIKLGFRATFITGLAIYSVGTLIFWPSAVLRSYPAYVVCNFINGFGVSILEIAANPFVALCGPPRHAETRLNISQGVQAIGTVVAPLLATKVLFKSVNDGGGLIDVQWAYLGIAFFDVGLAVIFYYLPIPEASADDFERVAEKRESINSRTIFGQKVIYVTLGLAVFSQFCYVGAQEAASEGYQNYMTIVAPNSPVDSFNWQTVGHTVFAVGRFATAGLGMIIQPRNVLLILYVGMIITAAVSMSAQGDTGIAMLTLYEAFQSGVFSLIFAIGLRGLGSFTKRGAMLLTMAVSGGAIVPVIASPVANAFGTRYAMCVPLACAVFGALFPIYMIVTPQARDQVDPVLGKTTLASVDEERGSHSRLNWLHNKWPRRLSKPTVEHVEISDTEKAMDIAS